MANDWELLQEFAERHSEEAFRALVERYAGLVYCAALRQTADACTAQDITPEDVYRIKSDLENQLVGLQNDATLSATQRVYQQNSLVATAQRAVTDKLGADGFASYKSNPSIFWLRPADATSPH